MSKTKWLVFLCSLLVLTVSCRDGIAPEAGDGGLLDDAGFAVPLELSCELLDTEASGPASRSMHDLSSLRKISNANYYVFKDGLLVMQGYFEDVSDFAVILPSKEDVYNLYILANVGEKAVSDGFTEDMMPTDLHHDYGSYDNYFSMIEASGFPMSAIVEGFSAESGGGLLLRRLVHTVYVSADTDALNSTEMKFTGLSIRNAARDFFPFASESKARYVMDGDAANLDADEMDAINRGEKVALYLLENMRGEVFPDNEDWKRKVPSRMTPYSEASYCSYIELTAEAQTATAHYANNVYRAYLGTSAADCNVRRHTYFELRNRFTNDAIEDEEWRIEGDNPVVNQTLAFVDTRYTRDTAPDKSASGDVSDRPFRDVEQFYIMNGFVALYYIYRSNPDIEYTLTMEANSAQANDCASHIQYEMIEVDDNFTALAVRTTYPIKTDGSYIKVTPPYTAGKSVSFIIRSSDGLITDRLVCRVLEAPFAVKMLYEGVSASSADVNSNHGGVLNMYMTNPLGLYAGVYCGGTVYGRCVHHPNGLSSAEKTKEYTVDIDTGNCRVDGQTVVYPALNGEMAYPVVPVVGEPCRVDLHKPQLEFGSGTFYRETDGFHEFMMDIWNNTAWDDNTWFGTSGKYKHAQPYMVELDVEMRFASPNNNRLHILRTSGADARVPLYVENALSGTDVGLLFHHANYTDYSKLIEFNTAESISMEVNGVKDWRSSQVTAMVRVGYGGSYTELVKKMINHEL